MAYTYQVGFNIRPDQMSELQIGTSLERVLAYLRALLPGERGHSSSRALSSLDIPGRTHILFESSWETWDDVEAHRRSSLAEEKILAEFEPHVTLQDLDVHVYRDVD
jgi:hypothetical protein